jgi:hypothetical protein
MSHNRIGSNAKGKEEVQRVAKARNGLLSGSKSLVSCSRKRK